MPAGYSATPLARKLGLRAGRRSWRHAMPDTVADEIAREASAIEWVGKPEAGLDFAHVFTASRAELADVLERLRPLLAQDGAIWVSWPKKSSKAPSDITEDTIRELAFPLDLVDIKVCAVDEIWSGLKLVIRKSKRVGAPAA